MADDVSTVSTKSSPKKPDKADFIRLIDVIKRNLLYGEDKINEVEKKIRNCRGDLNKEKILLWYATDSPFLSPDVVKMFLDLGSNVNDQDDQGRTILNWTIILDVGIIEDEDDDIISDDASKLELINFLIERGADVTLLDDDGNDPLKLSLISGQAEFIITRFIDAIKGLPSQTVCNKKQVKEVTPSSIINSKNKAGFTSLHLMLLTETNANVTLLKSLIDVGADGNIVDDENGNNGLHWLFHSYPYPANNSKYTQEARSQVNERYNFQKYPILFYSASGPKACFDLLTTTGVDVNCVNHQGKVPFELALTSPGPLNLDILSKLIPTKSELIHQINSQSFGSLSILKMLIKKDVRSIEIIEFNQFLDKLLNVGCNINQDGLLLDAIHNFKFKYELIKVLIANGMIINVQDIKECIDMRRIDVAHLLLTELLRQEEGKYENLGRNIENSDKNSPENPQKPSKIVELREKFPEIVCKSIGPFEWGAFDDDLKCTTLDIVQLLLEKFKLDVNYCNKDNFILHNLIIEYPTDSIKILEYLLTTFPNLDINRKVPMRSMNIAPWSDDDDDDDDRDGYFLPKEEDDEDKPYCFPMFEMQEREKRRKQKRNELQIVKVQPPNEDNQATPSTSQQGQQEYLSDVPVANDLGQILEQAIDAFVKDNPVVIAKEVPKEEDDEEAKEVIYMTDDGVPIKVAKESKNNPKYKLMSPLELAIKNDRYEFAIKLILNFASVTNLKLLPPTVTGFTHCYQLLYQLGIEMKNDDNGHLNNHSRGVQKELDWFNEWIDRQKSCVPTLTKLASLVIRRNVQAKEEIDSIINTIELPENIIKMLNLRDDIDIYVPNHDPTDRWFEDDTDDDEEYETDYEDDDSNYGYGHDDDHDIDDYYNDHHDFFNFFDADDGDGNDWDANPEDDDWNDFGFGVHVNINALDNADGDNLSNDDENDGNNWIVENEANGVGGDANVAVAEDDDMNDNDDWLDDADDFFGE